MGCNRDEERKGGLGAAGNGWFPRLSRTEMLRLVNKNWGKCHFVKRCRMSNSPFSALSPFL